MSITDLFVLIPVIVIAATSVVIMLTIAFHRNHLMIFLLTFFGISLAFSSFLIIEPYVPHRITSLLILDHYGLFYLGLIFSASLVVTILSYNYLKECEEDHEEFYILLLLATLGSSILVMSIHFASLFLGLEILSVSLYAFIAYLRTREHSIEAGIKYLVLASVSAAFLLFGMALIYSELGTMELHQMTARIATISNPKILLFSGLVMIIIGVGFKLALVPFHMWTPDVYEGAPAPVTSFVATVSKGTVFALLVRYFTQMNIQNFNSLFIVFTLISIASMFVGNLLALLQNNLKRILAYSSIAHLGYLLVAFLASGSTAIMAVSYYLVAYFVTTLGAFGVISVLSGKDRDADSLAEYEGLFWRRPWLATVFTAMILSLAGIPLTAGFIGKFYVILAGVKSLLWFLVIIMIINSAIGLFYYLRIIVAMFTHPKSEEVPLIASSVSLSEGFILTLLTLILIWLGIYPSILIDIIEHLELV
ncbi:MAG: NADH-quinone oxidoreductase subunit N [Nitrospirota bacterium]